MNQPVLLSIRVFVLVFLFTFAGNSLLAQQPANNPQLETSYEAVLQVIVGSNDASQRGNLPKSLSAVERQLHENFAYSGYRVSNMFLSRSTGVGKIEYKSMSDSLVQSAPSSVPTFLEWSLGIRGAAEPAGQNVLQVNGFRFGARVPITTARVSGTDGRSTDVTNYESIGLVTDRMALSVGKPSLVGTISLPGASGTLFLVLTLRSIAE
jgi:hypothetical protein